MIESYLTAYWIKIFGSLVVFIALIVIFIRQSRGKANTDPQAVVNVLNQLGSDYTVVPNVVVPGERGMFALGNVVVSPYGVFVITVKQSEGKVFGREGDSEWEVKSGRNSNLIRNPLWENRKHVNALEKVIGAVPFNSIVIFPRAVLKGAFGGNVIRLGELSKKITQTKTTRLSLDKRDKILKTLRK
jgi:restriction system protein